MANPKIRLPVYGVEIVPHESFASSSIDLYVMHTKLTRGPTERRFLAPVGDDDPCAFEWHDRPEMLILLDDGFGPAFRLQREQAQELMDRLWKCGLRPTEGSGSAGSLSATEKHLNDMRAIAFKKLGIGR